MNNLGFFGWIRDGVKQSVLAGVSDAIETIGTPEEASSLHPVLQSFAQSNTGRLAASKPMEGTARVVSGNTSTARKRLGRSLKDNIDAPKTT